MGSAINQFLVTNGHPVQRPSRTGSCMQAIGKNPGQIPAMRDSPDQRFFRVKVGVVIHLFAPLTYRNPEFGMG
jgi:hypothetical protein